MKLLSTVMFLFVLILHDKKQLETPSHCEYFYMWITSQLTRYQHFGEPGASTTVLVNFLHKYKVQTRLLRFLYKYVQYNTCTSSSSQKNSKVTVLQLPTVLYYAFSDSIQLLYPLLVVVVQEVYVYIVFFKIYTHEFHNLKSSTNSPSSCTPY